MMAVKHSAWRPSSWDPLTGALELGDALILALASGLLLVLVVTIWAWPAWRGDRREGSS